MGPPRRQDRSPRPRDGGAGCTQLGPQPRRCAAPPSACGPSPRSAFGLSLARGLSAVGPGAGSARRPASALPISAGERAEAIVRRTEVAFADAEAVWRRACARSPAGLRAGASWCSSPAAPAPRAPAAAGVRAVLLPGDRHRRLRPGFLDALGARLKRQRDLGLALYAARVSAEHLQRELGLLDAAALELIGARRGQRASDRHGAGAAGRLPDRRLGGGRRAAARPGARRLLGPAGLVVAQRRRRPRRARACGSRPSSTSSPPARQERAAPFAAGYAAGRDRRLPAALGRDRRG